MDPVQKAFETWKRKEAEANCLAAEVFGPSLSTDDIVRFNLSPDLLDRQSVAEEARRAATKAWYVYWERQSEVERARSVV